MFVKLQASYERYSAYKRRERTINHMGGQSFSYAGHDISGIDLSGRDRCGYCFDGANLRLANLRGALLCHALFRGANFTDAALEDTDLRGADFTGAILTGTCLDPRKTFYTRTLRYFSSQGFDVAEIDEEQRVYGWRTFISASCGTNEYDVGEHVAPVFSVDQYSPCHPGIYMDRIDRLWDMGLRNRLVVPCYAEACDLLIASGKYRARRITVVGNPRRLTRKLIQSVAARGLVEYQQ